MTEWNISNWSAYAVQSPNLRLGEIEVPQTALGEGVVAHPKSW
jgi:hypothetical protein